MTRSPPMRPAMRMPLKTRLGVEEAPIEPGLRWLRCEPCEAETPLKLWRFMTPAKPLPLLVPTTSTSWPASKIVDGELLAERVLGGVGGAHLGEVAARRDAGLLEVAGGGLVHLARVDLRRRRSARRCSRHFSAVRSWVTTFGVISTTVTGTSLLFSSQTWVMPSLVPSRPLVVLVAW